MTPDNAYADLELRIIVDTGDNELDRAQRRKPVAKWQRLESVNREVDTGGFEPPAFWLQTRRSSN